MNKVLCLLPVVGITSICMLYSGCKPENILNNTECATLHQGHIKIINNYQKTVRIYIDEAAIYSYNYDVVVPTNEIRTQAAGTGAHNYTVTDESGVVLDQAQLFIQQDCDTVVISKTGNGGGGGGGGSACLNGNWGSIKIQNSYGTNIRVYVDQSAVFSYNYNLLVPTGQTRYIYNLSVGPHKYTIADESGVIIDQAQIQINAPCDSSLISKNVPILGSQANATGCSQGMWGIIRVQNIYNQTIRVYVNPSAVFSYNYDMLVPAGQSRFYFSAYQGKHDFTLADESGVILDKAQTYINSPCDTSVIGPYTVTTGGQGPLNGCAGATWGTLKVVNTGSQRVRVYLGTGPVFSYNYDMLIPPSSTRFFYGITTGATQYTVNDESGVTIDQAQFNIATECDTVVVNVN